MMDSNLGPPLSEATALLTALQHLTYFPSKVTILHKKSHLDRTRTSIVRNECMYGDQWSPLRAIVALIEMFLWANPGLFLIYFRLF